MVNYYEYKTGIVAMRAANYEFNDTDSLRITMDAVKQIFDLMNKNMKIIRINMDIQFADRSTPAPCPGQESPVTKINNYDVDRISNFKYVYNPALMNLYKFLDEKVYIWMDENQTYDFFESVVKLMKEADIDTTKFEDLKGEYDDDILMGLSECADIINDFFKENSINYDLRYVFMYFTVFSYKDICGSIQTMDKLGGWNLCFH